ncbi:MAG TPA: hypothetical protein VE912_15900 [Bacteroidales bacterium]|nr:hypothetical protein [Bacteroidales bacterium]
MGKRKRAQGLSRGGNGKTRLFVPEETKSVTAFLLQKGGLYDQGEKRTIKGVIELAFAFKAYCRINLKNKPCIPSEYR